MITTLLLTDFYKIGHPFQYPKGTEYVYSNLTPRGSRLEGVDEMVFFGLQHFIRKYLIDEVNNHFFDRRLSDVLENYKYVIKHALGSDLPTYDHIEALHNLGYLPLKIKALPEGSLVPMRMPCMTIVNTKPEFYWLTNWVETLLCASIWQPCTSATIAYQYRLLLDKWAHKTGMDPAFVEWQGHDFSFRGMSSLESAISSGMGHLLSFKGTDTIPALCELAWHYDLTKDNIHIGGSVPATEHSVMCANGDDGEFDTFKRLITEVYPKGIVSIVSDTWDLWRVLNEYLPQLKDIILARDGKIVIRPDSGDPVDIICGTDKKEGVVDCLWRVFGGTITDRGYKLLDSHVGVIYGDSITLKRAKMICTKLMDKGYASQVVFGIGSYTYQYNTRDTFGMAMKATHVVINGKGQAIFKDPVTDDGLKRSAKGLLSVTKDMQGKYHLIENCTPEQESRGCLETVFENGQLTKHISLKEIRDRLAATY